MAGNIITLTDEQFEAEVIQSQTPVLVDFSAEWCGPCKMLAPIIEELANEYSERIKVGTVDIDTNREQASKYGVQGVPTLMIFKDGQVVKKFVGLMSKDKLTEALDEVL